MVQVKDEVIKFQDIKLYQCFHLSGVPGICMKVKTDIDDPEAVRVYDTISVDKQWTFLDNCSLRMHLTEFVRISKASIGMHKDEHNCWVV